jgi:ribosome maturation factor RimP
MTTRQAMGTKRKTESARTGAGGPAGRAHSAAASRPARPALARASRSPRSPLTPELEAELAAIAAGAGCELLAAEWKAGTLRLILDRPEAAAGSGPGTADPAAGGSGAGPTGDAGDSGARPGADAGPDRGADSGAAPEAVPEGVGGVEGVSLGDCEHVSKQVSALLDVADFGGARYVLEVSSPGLDRQLYRPGDYRRFRGRLARVSFDDPATGGKRTVVGRLEGLDEAAANAILALETAAPADPRRLVIPLNTIRLARLEIELERSEKKKK